MADVKWIKLSTKLFDNRKIRQIECLPDGDAIIVIWLKLLCLAGNINDSGMVYFTKEIPYTDQMLATQFNRPLTTVQLALKTFEQFEMIEIIDNILHISNWEKYQNVDRLSELREYNRIAKQKSRAKTKQKLLEAAANVNDMSMTSQPCQATDIDKEERKRIKNIEISAAQKKPTRFTPPSVEDVSQYCKERGNNVNAERFVDYYTANGWKVGKNPMKDWKAAVRTWERNEKATTLQKDNELAGIFE